MYSNDLEVIDYFAVIKCFLQEKYERNLLVERTVYFYFIRVPLRTTPLSENPRYSQVRYDCVVQSCFLTVS